MLCIVYTRPNGGTSIVRAAPGYRLVSRFLNPGLGDIDESLSKPFWVVFDPPVPADTLSHDAEKLKETARLGGLVWAETNEEFIARVAERSVPKDAIDVRVVDENDIPTDRTFRNALKNDLSHDMDQAREIWRAKMRDERAPLLAALDVEYMRADETGDVAAKSVLAAKKQALRDVTDDPAIVKAETPEDLKAVWPAVLAADAIVPTGKF